MMFSDFARLRFAAFAKSYGCCKAQAGFLYMITLFSVMDSKSGLTLLRQVPTDPALTLKGAKRL